ncbi:MAG: transposase [Planctomycetaceae bacterium]|jgi:transposase
MTTTRATFEPEFKKDAVALVTEQNYSVANAAQAVGTSENNIRRWMKLLNQEASGERLPSGDREELVRLRRENKELRIEKEILKKASVFFAKEMS